jgi:hypothetical protein
MSNELATAASLTNLPCTDLDELDEYKFVSKWLPRLQLFGSNKEVKKGLIGPGHWGIPGKESVEDLGMEIDALVIGYRFKALDTNGDDNIVCYDRSDPVYQEIKATAAVYVKGGSGCMEGPEFLLYVRGFGYCTYFCMNKSALICAGQMKPFLPISDAAVEQMAARGKTVTAQGPQTISLVGEFKDKGQVSYWAPEATRCSTPIEVDLDELNEQALKFANPEAEKQEVDTDDR